MPTWIRTVIFFLPSRSRKPQQNALMECTVLNPTVKRVTILGGWDKIMGTSLGWYYKGIVFMEHLCIGFGLQHNEGLITCQWTDGSPMKLLPLADWNRISKRMLHMASPPTSWLTRQRVPIGLNRDWISLINVHWCYWTWSPVGIIEILIIKRMTIIYCYHTRGFGTPRKLLFGLVFFCQDVDPS